MSTGLPGGDEEDTEHRVQKQTGPHQIVQGIGHQASTDPWEFWYHIKP